MTSHKKDRTNLHVYMLVDNVVSIVVSAVCWRYFL